MVRQPSEKLLALLLVSVAAVVGALPPLHEMDLAQHLATGEWIVRHGAVPVIEPFAWTREGQPYYAYSWLPQVLFFGLLDAVGPLGLHLLEGLLVGASVASALWAGKTLGWKPAVRLTVGVLHLALLWGVAPTLRPQQFLFITLPLAWAVVARIHYHGSSWPRLLALAGVGALAVNTHIFFPLTAAPVGYFLLAGTQTRRTLFAGAALVAGWLLTPYLLVLPQVFALNFGHNVLLNRPPSVAEFIPGFEYARLRTGVIVAVIALLAAPWIVAAQQATLQERIVRAAYWLVGLALFAFAGRLVVVWWTLAFPLVGLAAEQLLTAGGELIRRPAARIVAASLTAIVILVSAPEINPIFWLFEGDTKRRILPRSGEDPALWLPPWLLCNTRAGATGRIYTEFNYGSELNWSLPGYSPSIDGRTIFPDSDAVEFSYQPLGRRVRHATTWKYADLALLDRSFWLAPVLDADTAWILLAEGRRTSRGQWGALWAKREWWQRFGRPTKLPALDVRTADPRGMCAASGFADN